MLDTNWVKFKETEAAQKDLATLFLDSIAQFHARVDDERKTAVGYLKLSELARQRFDEKDAQHIKART